MFHCGISAATYRQILSSTLVLLTSFLYGCKIGFTQFATAVLLSPQRPFVATPGDISWLASISYTGTLISLAGCYVMGDRVSRKMVMFCGTLTYAVVWLLIWATSSIRVVIVCFFFYGIAASMTGIVGSLYLVEIATPENRDALVVVAGLACNVGVLVEYSLSAFENYRLMSLFPLLVALTALASASYMIESPCYLIARGTKDNAVRNLCWLTAKIRADDVTDEYEHAKKYIEEQRTLRMAIGDFGTLLRPANLKLATVMTVMNAVLMISCSTITAHYGDLMIDGLGATVNRTLFVNGFNVLGLAGSVSGLFMLTAFNRQTMLMSGFVLTGLVQLGCAYCYGVEARHGDRIPYLANAIVFLLLLHILICHLFFIAFGILKMEVFPHTLKEFYVGLLSLAGDWASFATVKSYITLSSSLGVHNVLVIYAFLAFFNAWMAYTFISDTKGKTLHQIRTEYVSLLQA